MSARILDAARKLRASMLWHSEENDLPADDTNDLQAVGLTDEQIVAFRELVKAVDEESPPAA